MRKFYGEHAEVIEHGWRHLRYRYIVVDSHTLTIVTKRMTLESKVVKIEFSTLPTNYIQSTIDEMREISMEVAVGNINVSIEFIQNLFAGL